MSNLNASASQGAPLQAQQHQIERALAMARMFVALVALAVLFATPRSAPQYADLGRLVAIAYAAFAAMVITVVQTRPTIWIASRLTVHVVDIVAAVALTVATSANGPFFILFLPPFLAAGLRWGCGAASRQGGMMGSMMPDSLCVCMSFWRSSRFRPRREFLSTSSHGSYSKRAHP